jgi:hypothetical protein
MALSTKARARLEKALAKRSEAKEIADAIDGNSHPLVAHIAAIATADATDLASSEALANACKAKINALIAALIAAGLMS